MRRLIFIALLLLFPSPALAGNFGTILPYYHAAGGGGGSFYLDTFTVATDTALTSHTADTGSGVYTLRDDDNMLVDATGDYLYHADNGADMFRYSVTPPSADYTTIVTGHISQNLDSLFGSCVRLTSGFSGYCVFLQYDHSWLLRTIEYASGSSSTLSEKSVSITVGNDYKIAITASGSALTANLYDASNNLIDSDNTTDTTISAAGAPGGVLYRDDTFVYITGIEAY